MNSDINWNILDKNRKEILPNFQVLKDSFYLAGGTALALQMDHRESIDFDFFTEKSFKTDQLLDKLKKSFENRKITIIQEKKDTLSIKVDGIEISCFSYKYPLLEPLIETEYLKLASINDIAAMKLSAIVSRATLKDYIDIYYILKQISLKELILITKQKFPELDTNLILKSLTYFKDIKEEPIVFKKDKEVKFETIKKFLTSKVKKYIQST